MSSRTLTWNLFEIYTYKSNDWASVGMQMLLFRRNGWFFSNRTTLTYTLISNWWIPFDFFPSLNNFSQCWTLNPRSHTCKVGVLLLNYLLDPLFASLNVEAGYLVAPAGFKSLCGWDRPWSYNSLASAFWVAGTTICPSRPGLGQPDIFILPRARKGHEIGHRSMILATLEEKTPWAHDQSFLLAIERVQSQPRHLSEISK